MRAVAVLLIVALSGCTQVVPPEEVLYERVGPSVGELFVYEGNNGGILAGGITGTEVRLDAYARPVEAWILEYRYSFGDQLASFEEAIDDQGRIVSQTAFCGTFVDGTCANLTTVITAGMGLPGAFGAAPEWLGFSAGTAVPLDDPQPITYLRKEPGCVTWTGDGPSTLRVLPWTHVAGVVSLCAHPYPDRIVTTHSVPIWGNDTTFQLVSYTSGPSRALAPGGAFDDLKGVPIREAGTPFGQALDLEFAISLRDAHELAMEDSEYASKYADGGLHTFEFQRTQTASGAAGQDEWHARLVAASGAGRQILVERTHTYAGGQLLDQEFSISTRTDVAAKAPVEMPVIDLQEAFNRSANWISLPFAEHALFTHGRHVLLPFWAPANTAPDRPLVAFTFGEELPYVAVFDVSGALLHVDLPADAVPFDGRYGVSTPS